MQDKYVSLTPEFA